LKRLYKRDDRSGVGSDILERTERILAVLDSATTPQALNVPAYRLHRLKGDLEGFWSVTVRANWRIVFRFEGTDAFDVELIDYY
jgi:proteic killer suppression protein